MIIVKSFLIGCVMGVGALTLSILTVENLNCRPLEQVSTN